MDHQLFTLLRNYYALTPVNRLQLPLEPPLNRINDFLVCEILINEHHQQYPPSPEYQKRFWKWAIEHLEELARVQTSEEDDEEFEIDSRIYDYYLSLVLPAGPPSGSSYPSAQSRIYGKGCPRSVISPPSQSYVTHFWNMLEPPRTSPPSSIPLNRNDFHTASLLESRTVVERGTTGLRTWLASFFLAQYLILHPDLVTSKRVMELGSGIGFLGIIIASLQQLDESASKGKGSCWLTDINDEVLNRCRNNVNLPCNISSTHSNMHYRILDWHESLEENSSMTTVINDDINPDLILGTDVAYDPSLIPPLVETLKIALHHSPRPAIIAITLRNEETWNYFFSSLARASLYVEELTTGFDRPSFWETVENQDSYWVVKLIRIVSTP